MIPYDDLVAALSAWRARQGLPVSTLGGGGSGATAQPGSGPNRGGPPATPGSGRTKAPSMPPPMPDTHDELDVDAASLLEEQYENEGADFGMSFGQGNEGNEAEATSIGGAPERPTEADMKRRDDRDDW